MPPAIPGDPSNYSLHVQLNMISPYGTETALSQSSECALTASLVAFPFGRGGWNELTAGALCHPFSFGQLERGTSIRAKLGRG